MYHRGNLLVNTESDARGRRERHVRASRATTRRGMTGPLSFSMSAEQEALVDVARGFGERRLAPYYKQREQEGAFDHATLRAMGDLGLFGVELPEECGGLGLDCTTAGLVLEAISRSDYNIGQLMVTISLSGAIMARHGDPAVAGRRIGRREPHGASNQRR